MLTTHSNVLHRFFIFVTIISLLIGTSAFAQEPMTEAQFNALSPEEQQALIQSLPPGPSLPPSPEAPANTVNCFDYYKFGSIQADLSTVVSETVPGIPLTFNGNIKNENPYPIVNGSLYVKIFKTDSQDESNTKANGYPLVAFFEAGKDIQIAGNGSVPYTFDWQVPLAIQGGTYEADFFFVTDRRFNLLGLSFTDDVTGNKTSFAINDTVNTQVTFNKHKVTLNDERYNFAAFPPHFDMNEPVTVDVPITNPDTNPRTISLTWNLYNWDGLREEFLLDTYTEVITLKPKETQNVSYTATEYGGTVSYIVATLDDQGVTSIINPRFVRDSISEVRLNFPSIMSFPIEAGKEQTLFSCAHSTNLPIVPDNTITMTLTDLETNETIHTYTYQGGITGAMMGVKDTFTPTRSYGKVKLTTMIAHAGETLDEVSQTYDCDALGVACPTNSILDAFTNGKATPPWIYIHMIIASLLILFLVLSMKKRLEKPTTDFKMPTA